MLGTPAAVDTGKCETGRSIAPNASQGGDSPPSKGGNGGRRLQVVWMGGAEAPRLASGPQSWGLSGARGSTLQAGRLGVEAAL